jgi:hypothetical protein
MLVDDLGDVTITNDGKIIFAYWKKKNNKVL